MQFVAPGKNELASHVLDEGGLEVVKFHRTVGAVINSKLVVRCQLHLLQLQIYGLVDTVDELINRGIDSRKNRRLLIYFELELCQ